LVWLAISVGPDGPEPTFGAPEGLAVGCAARLAATPDRDGCAMWISCLRIGRGLCRKRGASTFTAGSSIGAAGAPVAAGAFDGASAVCGSAVAACWSMDMTNTPSPQPSQRFVTATLVATIVHAHARRHRASEKSYLLMAAPDAGNAMITQV
jgi:hypothetical protein